MTFFHSYAQKALKKFVIYIHIYIFAFFNKKQTIPAIKGIPVETMKKWEELFWAIILMTLGATQPCVGQTVSENVQHDRYTLYYYHDRIDIDSKYLDNAYQIYRIRNILARSTRIDSITIYAYASPEGSPVRNKWFAEQRALAARDFILENLPDSSVILPENIHLRPMGENWEGLENELEEHYHQLNRDKVMKIIRADIPTETKKWRLQNLDNGHTYKYIIHNHMPRLRMATWVCVYAPFCEPTLEFDDSLSFPKTIDPIEIPVQSEERKTIMAIKSNLLYDALTLLNYSVEVPLGKHVSVLYYHQFPWWRWGEAKNEYCLRFLSIGTEARIWARFNPNAKIHAGRDKMTGHFFGIYAESGKWDFQWKRSICHQGEHWSTGLTYGYSMPIGKVMNLEFSLSMGYASIPYRRFIPSDNYEILWREPGGEGRWHYFGPTKAQISLSLPIKITTRKKGGKQ